METETLVKIIVVVVIITCSFLALFGIGRLVADIICRKDEP